MSLDTVCPKCQTAYHFDQTVVIDKGGHICSGVEQPEGYDDPVWYVATHRWRAVAESRHQPTMMECEDCLIQSQVPAEASQHCRGRGGRG